jgi:hypothetical protein
MILSTKYTPFKSAIHNAPPKGALDMNPPKPRRLSSGNYFIQLRLGGESVPVTARSAAEYSRMAALIKGAPRRETCPDRRRNDVARGNGEVHQVAG